MTATEALRQCIEAMKLVDFKDCAESAELWQKLNHAQANAERVLRDGEKQEPVGWVLPIQGGSNDVYERGSQNPWKESAGAFAVYTHPAPSLQAVGAVPEGWKLVPIEPTDAMLTEVEEEVGGSCYSCSKWNASWDDCRRVYAAMLSAIPQPAAAPQWQTIPGGLEKLVLPAAAPSGDVERDAVAEAIFKAIKPSNMTDKDWRSGAILGFENGFRDQVKEAAKAAIAAITSTKE